MSSNANAKVKRRKKSIHYWQLFRYATPTDYLLLVISFLAIIVRAAATPACLIIFTEIVAMLVDRNLGIGTSSTIYFIPLFGGGKILTNATREENLSELRNDSWSFGIAMSIMATVMFISGIIYVDLMNLVAVRIMLTMRKKFFEATIRKDIGWHDVTGKQNFAVRMTDNMEKIRDGISEKLGHFCQLFISVIITITTSFVYGWKLTLIMSAYIPIILLSNYFVAKYQSKLTLREQDSYVNAGSLVEEIIGGIRTVVAFGGEHLEADRYDKYLIPAREASKRKGAFSGIGEAVTRAMEFFSSAVVFSYGARLVLADRDKLDPEYTPAVLLIAFLGILVGADNIARCSPFLDCFGMALGSAVPIFEVIDSATNIDPMSGDGKTLNDGLKGGIEFQDVFFRYPSRGDIVVLSGLNLKISAGQSVALVGHSGCGKSTCLQLLQRFYDPLCGSVILDDTDIRKYNVSWLRSNIAIVGQEPVLFQGTIGENIGHGRPGATDKHIEAASRAAGAHEFIIELPNGYETSISEKGVQLSGGQKQRIAIARALIQNPKILLLDEATSALDYHSEKLVQKALNAASVGRTTIVVSHRLSAIKHVDRIVFIHEGKAVEDGSHDELMELRGKYFDMVTAHKSDDVSNDNQDETLKHKENDTMPAASYNQFDRNLDKHRYSITSRAASNIGSIKGETVADEAKFISTFIRILKLARQEWCFLVIATVCSTLYGCAQPALAFILGEFYAALAQTDPDAVLRRSADLSIICLVVGCAIGTACFVQTYLFNLSGVRLTTKLRSVTFKAILTQEMGWFDDKTNSIGALSARLSGDAASVQGSIGYPLSGIIRALANFICCLSIAFYFSWQIALVSLCTAPFMVGSIVLEARFIAKSSILEKGILEETSRIATEAIANIRTVAGLCRESILIKEYNAEVAKYGSQLRHRLRFRGLVNASGWSALYLGYAVALTYGGILCSEEKIEFQNVIKVADCMLYGFMILAWSLAFTPAFTTAIIAGHRLFQIVDRKPRMRRTNSCKNLRIENSTKGVTYNDVSFHYPTRPDVKVLNGLNLSVLQGKTVALVGASGCGKSTCIQLLLRYYDPDGGKIYLDGQDIERNLAPKTLRHRLGIVSQEPILFEKTIAENIAYGDNTRSVAMTEILDAAKLANAFSFITALPNGFDTKLGARGTQLSGGQKQRIAIARALVRNPQVLLLDEATSALDLQSERIVQSALDTACSGRTCIVVAHRLSTIQNADLICVLQDGQIVEQGNHAELLDIDGTYAKLYKSQPAAS